MRYKGAHDITNVIKKWYGEGEDIMEEVFDGVKESLGIFHLLSFDLKDRTEKFIKELDTVLEVVQLKRGFMPLFFI